MRWLLLALLTGLLAACSPRAGAGLPSAPTTALRDDTTATVPQLTATVPPPTATTALRNDTTATVPQLTATVPPPTATIQAGDGPGGCVLGATFLGDSSPPTGALVAPGAALVKSWRVRNDGTCAWTADYALVFIGGDQLSATAGRIPPTQPGAQDLLSIRLQAPTAAGAYSSVWQLRASNGAAFGQIAASIRVAAPATPVPTPLPPAPVVPSSPTAVPTIVPTPGGSGPAGCTAQMTLIGDITMPSGTTVNPRTRFVKIWRVRNDGTCAWGAGYNLLFADGEPMGAASETAVPATLPGQEVDLSLALDAPREPGLHSGSWQIQTNNGLLFGTLEVNINVLVGPTATPVPTVDPLSPWAGTWESDCGTFACGTVSLGQTGDGVSGTFGDNGTLTGSVDRNQLVGDWEQNGDSGIFALTMTNDGQSWVGTISPGSPWCGWRSGTPKPSACVP